MFFSCLKKKFTVQGEKKKRKKKNVCGFSVACGLWYTSFQTLSYCKEAGCHSKYAPGTSRMVTWEHIRNEEPQASIY